jgi:hypothetical protein
MMVSVPLGTQCVRPPKDHSALMINDPRHYRIDLNVHSDPEHHHKEVEIYLSSFLYRTHHQKVIKRAAFFLAFAKKNTGPAFWDSPVFAELLEYGS